MRSLSDIFRPFREKLSSTLVWEYIVTLKNAAWERFWGATVPALIFGIITLWYSPTRGWFLLYLLFVVFLAGYHLWRADHVRLMPKLRVKGFKVQETSTTAAGERRAYVQLIVGCSTNAPVPHCKGNLLGVYNRYRADEEWKPTELNESVDLRWSIYERTELTLEPTVDRRLNVCYRRNDLKMIIPTVDVGLLRWKDVFNSPGTFRFDITITADDCPPVPVSVEVNIDNCAWNEPRVELGRCGKL